MPPRVSGVKSEAIRQLGTRGTSDRFGLDVQTLIEEVPDALFPQGLKKKGSAHPRFSAMALSRYDYERGKGGAFWMVTYTYEGFLTALPEPTYQMEGSLSQEPIQTHPDFEAIAGTPEAPLNGAIFIDPETDLITTDSGKGVFREFGAGAGSKAGVDSFLDPAVTWTETKFTLASPSLRDLGKTDSPDGPNPSLSGRDWLTYTQSAEKRGHVWQLRTTWKLSGRGGWDPDIY